MYWYISHTTALEEAQGILANQDKTIQDLKDQFAVTLANKQEEYAARDQDNTRKREELERRLHQVEVDAKGIAASEKALRAALASVEEENRLLQKQSRYYVVRKLLSVI